MRTRRDGKASDHLIPGRGRIPTAGAFQEPPGPGYPPRCPRPRKNSSVRSADSFSATATLMSWFNATPSALVTRRASSSREL